MGGNIFVVCILMAASLIAGCTTPHGDEVSVGFSGEIGISNDSFRMTGNITSGSAPADQTAFNNVSVVLVNSGSAPNERYRLGDLPGTAGRLPVAISTNDPPAFVVIVSDDFWDEQVAVQYWERVDGEYHSHEATSRSELPGLD